MNHCTTFRACLLVAIGVLADCRWAVAQPVALPAGLTPDVVQSGTRDSQSQHAGSDAVVSGATAAEADWDALSDVLDACSPTTTETWDDATCRTLHQGAYLGNGDFGIHLGGTKHSLVYYLGKNGFHAGNNLAGAEGDGKWTQHILNLAILTVEKSGGTDAGDDYHVTQDLKNSEIRTSCSMAGAAVQTRACLSPSSNAMVLELSTNSGRAVALQVTLAVIGNEYVAKRASATESVAWVTKEPNAEGAPFYVKGAVAARVLGAEAVLTTDGSTSSRLAFSLPASGAAVTLFVQAEHRKNADSPLAAVQTAAHEITDARIATICGENRAWWKDFWLRAYVRLGDDVQKYWYNHLYLMGSAARSSHDNGPGKAGPLGALEPPRRHDVVQQREHELQRTRPILRGLRRQSAEPGRSVH